MTSLQEAMSSDRFLVTAELEPPKGTELEPLAALAQSLGRRLDALVVSDNNRAQARLDPLAAALLIKERAACQLVITLTCRDRNRLALTSQMLAAGAAGFGNLLLVSGDFVSLGDHPGAKPVYDLDSVQALDLAGKLASGRDLAGNQLQGAPSFFLGAGVAPAAQPLALQALKARKKIQAGARFLVTRPLAEVAELEALLAELGSLEVPLLAGVEVGEALDKDRAAELVKQIKSGNLARGVHLSAPGDPAGLEALLDLCGLG